MTETVSKSARPSPETSPAISRDLSSNASSTETSRSVNFDEDMFEIPTADLPQFTVKFIFPANKDPDTIPTHTPAQLHSMILLKLYDLHRGYFRAISNVKQAPLEMKQRQKLRTKPNIAHSRYFTTLLTNGTLSKKSKTLVPTDRSISVKMVHTIQSTLSLQDIKNIPAIKRILIEHNCYIRLHRWETHETETSVIGWILNTNPNHQSIDTTHSEITEMIRKAHKTTKITIPKFRIILNNPTIGYGNNKKKTRAYAIETLSTDKPQLISILSKTFKSTKTFIPYYLLKQDPDAFAFAIDLQNKYLSSHKAILIRSLSDDILFFLQAHLLNLPKVKKLIPTHKQHSDGEYRLIVESQAFSSTRKSLKTSLPIWFSESASDAQAVHNRTYNTEPHVVSIRSDEYSSDDGSYLSGLRSVLTAHSDCTDRSPPSEYSFTSKVSDLTNLTTSSIRSAPVSGTELDESLSSEDELMAATDTNPGLTKISNDRFSSFTKITNVIPRTHRETKIKPISVLRKPSPTSLNYKQAVQQNQINSSPCSSPTEPYPSDIQLEMRDLEQRTSAMTRSLIQDMTKELKSFLIAEIHQANLEKPPYPETTAETTLITSLRAEIQSLKQFIQQNMTLSTPLPQQNAHDDHTDISMTSVDKQETEVSSLEADDRPYQTTLMLTPDGSHTPETQPTTQPFSLQEPVSPTRSSLSSNKRRDLKRTPTKSMKQTSVLTYISKSTKSEVHNLSLASQTPLPEDTLKESHE